MGHVIGRSMMNMFEGRDTQEVVNEIESTPVAQEDGACPVQFKAFKMCLESTGDDVSQCQWAYDMFRDCAGMLTQTPSRPSIQFRFIEPHSSNSFGRAKYHDQHVQWLLSGDMLSI